MKKKNCPEQYKRIILKFKKHLQQVKCPASAEMAEEYLTRLNLEQDFSKSNLRLHIAAIKWHMKHQIGITLDIKTPYRYRPIPTLFSVREMQIIFDALPQKYLLIFKLMYGLGMKIGEVLGLRMIDIDLHNGIIHLPKKRQIKIPHIIFNDLDKFYRQRYKQYRLDQRQRLTFIIDSQGQLSREFDEQPFFSSRKSTKINTRGQRGHSFITPATIHRLLKQVKNEGIIGRHLTTMALRHSFAMELLASGHNILELMQVLGHQDIRLTLNYLRATPAPVRSPLDSIDFSSDSSKAQTAVHSEVKQQSAIRTTNTSEIKPTSASHTKEVLNKLLQAMSPEQIERISLCKDSQRWQQWLDKAKDKKLNYLCYRNESLLFLQCTVPVERVRTTIMFCDYLFMDIREIARHSNPLQDLQFLQECLRKTKKSLILYAGSA